VADDKAFRIIEVLFLLKYGCIISSPLADHSNVEQSYVMTRKDIEDGGGGDQLWYLMTQCVNLP
jgi:hypothetical protein